LPELLSEQPTTTVEQPQPTPLTIHHASKLTLASCRSSMTKLVVSVAQACTHRYELEPTLAKMDRLVRQAKERDCSQLVVFPEALCVRQFLGRIGRWADRFDGVNL
jgi:hypothetical protein